MSAMPVVARLRRWSGTWASDLVLTAAVLLAQMWPLLFLPREGGGHWSWWGYVAVTGSALPLAFRRRAPVLVLLLSTALGTSYDLVTPLARQPVWYGPILANYTLGSRSGRAARTGVIALQLVLTVVIRPSPDTLFRGVFLCVTAYAVGRAVALGRAHAAALEDRAARAENERRLEAARAEAESERATAESERAAAEAERATAEAERAAAESERAEAEAKRATAEAERAVADAERAAAAERARIARDMHDILAHAVSLMIVQAESGPLLVASDPARAAAVFDSVAETGRDAMAQLRRVLALLKDGEDASRAPQPTLADLPELAERVAGAGLAVEYRELGEPRPLPPDTGLAAYRIAQEALTNTVKHAGAEHAELTLHWRDGTLELTVRDDGRNACGDARNVRDEARDVRDVRNVRGAGDDDDRAAGDDGRAVGAVGAERPPGGGNGLIGIRERAAACGGTAEAGPRDDGRPGFAVRAVLPTRRDRSTPPDAADPASGKISA